MSNGSGSAVKALATSYIYELSLLHIDEDFGQSLNGTQIAKKAFSAACAPSSEQLSTILGAEVIEARKKLSRVEDAIDCVVSWDGVSKSEASRIQLGFPQLLELFQSPYLLATTFTVTPSTTGECNGFAHAPPLQATTLCPDIDWTKLRMFHANFARWLDSQADLPQSTSILVAIARTCEGFQAMARKVAEKDTKLDKETPLIEGLIRPLIYEDPHELVVSNLPPVLRPPGLRALLVLISHPLHEYFTPHGCFADVLRTISVLPVQAKKILLNWYAYAVPKETFSNHLTYAQCVVSLTLLLHYNEGGLLQVIAAVSNMIQHAHNFVKILYLANGLRELRWGRKLRGEPCTSEDDEWLAPLQFEEFCNDAENEIEDIIISEMQKTVGWMLHGNDDTKHPAEEKIPETEFNILKHSYTLTTERKRQWLEMTITFYQRHELTRNATQFLGLPFFPNPFFILSVRRDHILEDSLHQILDQNTQAMKRQLKVKFVGEEGVDEGGVKKEFFQLLVMELFNPDFGMFTHYEDTGMIYYNPHSFESDREFELCGAILGLALYNGVMLNVYFPHVVYKKLLKQTTNLRDLVDFQPEFAKSLHYLLFTFTREEIESSGLTFSTTVDSFGTVEDVPLSEKYAPDTPVTYENRFDYADVLIEWQLNKSVEKQFKAFANGFAHVVENRCYRALNFHPMALQQLVCGCQSDLEAHDLQRATEYQHGFTEESQTIVDFWEIVFGYTQDDLRKLLWFVTGSDRVPIGGLRSMRFIIGRNGPDSNKLPTAHTCFNFLLLPDYKDKTKLARLLHIALQNAQGFGLR